MPRLVGFITIVVCIITVGIFLFVALLSAERNVCVFFPVVISIV